MQTTDIAKSTQCWCERIWAADLARSAPLTLRSHALVSTSLSACLARGQLSLAVNQGCKKPRFFYRNFKRF